MTEGSKRYYFLICLLAVLIPQLPHHALAMGKDEELTPIDEQRLNTSIEEVSTECTEILESDPRTARCKPEAPKKDHEPIAHARSVYISEVRATEDGDLYYVRLLKKGGTWLNTQDDPGPQGDVRFFRIALEKLLGAKKATRLANYLGFKQINEDVESYPSPEFLRNKLKKLESRVTFFPAPGDDKFKERDYLENFAKGAGLPIGTITPSEKGKNAADCRYNMHDTTYHVLGYLAMPTEYNELAQAQSQSIFEFEKFLKNHEELVDNPAAKLEDRQLKPHLRQMIDGWILEKVKNIDAGTGNTTTALFQRGTTDIEASQKRAGILPPNPTELYISKTATVSDFLRKMDINFWSLEKSRAEAERAITQLREDFLNQKSVKSLPKIGKFSKLKLGNSKDKALKKRLEHLVDSIPKGF